jgi:hypothetical protein
VAPPSGEGGEQKDLHTIENGEESGREALDIIRRRQAGRRAAHGRRAAAGGWRVTTTEAIPRNRSRIFQPRPKMSAAAHSALKSNVRTPFRLMLACSLMLAHREREREGEKAQAGVKVKSLLSRGD